MNKIKILVATHKKYDMPEDDIYLPIHVGRIDKDDIGYQGDHTGNNISSKNPNYCELTGLYWAWKNLNCDYIGLCHYRRYFTADTTLKKIFKKGKRMESILSESEIGNLLSRYEVILPRKRNYYIETVWSQYKNAHNINDLLLTKEIIEKDFPEYLSSFNKVMNSRKLHLYNMFIMSKTKFNDYCEWLFKVLFELEKRVDINDYDDYQKRIFGFISERLFNVWLTKHQYKSKEIGIQSLEHINWRKKSTAFILRKYKHGVLKLDRGGN